MRRVLSIVTVAGVLATGASAQAQEGETAQQRFQRSWYQEVAEGRYEDALATYESLAEDAKAPAALRAKALFRKGVCLQQLGRGDDAISAFQRVVLEFPAVKAVVQEAQKQIRGETEAQAAFRKKVQSLLPALGSDNKDAREQARQRLEMVGPEAVPFVMQALAGENYFASQGAALLLVRFAEQDARLVPRLIAAVEEGDAIAAKGLLHEIEASSDLPLLSELLEANSAAVRAAAIRGIRTTNPSDENATHLIGMATRGESVVRVEALRALGQLRHADAIPVTLEALDSNDEAVRNAAIHAMYQHVYHLWYGSGSGSHRITGQLHSKDLEEGARLASLSYVYGVMARRYRAPSVAHQRAIVAVVGRRLARLAGAPRLQSILLLGACSKIDGAVTLLGQVLAGEDLASAQVAALALAQLRRPESATALRTVLGRTTNEPLIHLCHRALRRVVPMAEVVKTLDRLPDALVSDVLAEIQRSGDRAVARAAVPLYPRLRGRGRIGLLDTITKFKLPSGVTAVVQGLGDRDSAVVYAAIIAALELRHPDTVAPLLALLRAPSSEGRFAELYKRTGRSRGNYWARDAARALHAIGTIETIPGLLAALSTKNQTARSVAGTALWELARPTDVPALAATLLAETAWPVRKTLIRLLGRVGSAKAADALLTIILRDNELQENRIAAVRAIAALPVETAVRLLGDLLQGSIGEVTVQSIAVSELAGLQHPRVRDLILGAVWSPRKDVRTAALGGLRAMPLDPSLVPKLVELLRHPDQQARKLTRELISEIRYYEEQKAALSGASPPGKTGPAFRELLAMCASRHATVRAAAVTALARVGSPDALTTLLRLRKDRDPAVRTAVDSALDALSARKK